ncbi:MAG: hypothetical protein PHE53_01225 [Thermoguttaceae bacterium]|nr:hypothetical protein [Thermoguttaceae bacterium]
MDYSFAKNARECSVTHRVFAPGEAFYSLLIEEMNGRFTRRDYSVEAWNDLQRDPEYPKMDGVVGFWKSKIPDLSSKRQRWAPNEILLRYFEELENRPDCDDTRYVLALLLVRRRLLVCDDEHTEEDRSFLTLHDPKRDLNFEVEVLTPSTERYDAIQQQLAELLQ